MTPDLPKTRTFIAVSGATIALYLLLAPTASALAQDTYCDPKLGRDYDQQTAEVKMARSNLYFYCRLSRDIRLLQTLRKDILIGIRRWQSRATVVIRSSLSTKRSTADAELTTAQRRTGGA